MLEKSLARIEAIVLEKPRTVLTAAVLLCLAAAWLGMNLEVRTSRWELVPEGDVNQARWDAVRADFSDPEPLIVAIERESDDVPTATLERAAERIATRLEGNPLVSSVFYRVDLDWLSDHALHLAPPELLTDAIRELGDALTDDDGFIRLSNFADLNDRVARRIEASLTEGALLPSGTERAEARWLRDFIDAESEFLAAPAEWAAGLASTPLGLINAGARASLTPNGFLSTDDGDVLFVLVHLAGTAAEGLERQQRVVSAARDAATTVTAGIDRVHFGLTGPPAMEVEEMAAISDDGKRTSAIAIVGVFLLSLLAFHRRFHALLGLGTLTVGVICAVGAVQLELGYLNLITTALIPILVGMGIDYAVHPISQYELERRHHDRITAVRETFRKTGRPVVVSALTTSAAFFCFLLMEFRGFAELGLVTGIGVLLCLLSALFVLPSLLVLCGRGHREDRGAAVDKLWDEGAAAWVISAPRRTVTIALALSLLALPLAWQVRVNRNVLDLLPVGAESLHYLQVMNARSALRNDFNLVIAEDLDELRDMRDRMAGSVEIERFESLLTFLPDDPAAAAIAVEHARRFLERASIEHRTSTAAELGASLQRLEAALSEAADAAFLTGFGDIAGELEGARITVAELVQQVASSGPVERATWIDGERVLQTKVGILLERIRAAAEAPMPTPQSLPENLTSRFVTSAGRYVAYLYPAGDIYDTDFLPRFNRASAAISDTAIGFPVLFEDHSGLITAGFGSAMALGAVLVTLLLVVDLRSFTDTLLALVPVGLGILWMLALMILLGMNFNFANLVAVPIVLGVGIDAGVHLVHRYRLEGQAGMITTLAHTGRAILVASLTTMVGFGSLTLASHRGMASLGALLFLGVGGCLVAAIVVLPNLMLSLGLARR